jgi:hypothetical protein
MASMWAQDQLFVDVSVTEDGSLRFSGYDLKGDRDYEYFLTVAEADVPTILAALPGPPEDDVITRLLSNADMIIKMGELAWLESLGITPGFWSHGEWTLFE